MEIANRTTAPAIAQPPMRKAKFAIGQVVKHRLYPFRGVIFDVDPVFANTEEWLASIPENARPRRDQPFYHLLAENAQTTYVAYVSEQNLLPDTVWIFLPTQHRSRFLIMILTETWIVL